MCPWCGRQGPYRLSSCNHLTGGTVHAAPNRNTLSRTPIPPLRTNAWPGTTPPPNTLEACSFRTTTFLPLTTQPTVWSDYDGDEAYGDFTVASISPWTVTNLNSYEPGAWRKVGGIAEYLHSDHLGTLRAATNSGGTSSGGDVFTAFGERIGGANDRFGYVGGFGYQSHSIAESPNPDAAFPFLHVGARYYDPSSGRFLQRDPIGIRDGTNVYGYVNASPTEASDPSGLGVLLPGPPKKPWDPMNPQRPKHRPIPGTKEYEDEVQRLKNRRENLPVSVEEIKEQLRREQTKQLITGGLIAAGGLVSVPVGILALCIDISAGWYAKNNPF